MSGNYPEYPPSGRADDLLSILARAESLRYARAGVVLPEKPDSSRAWVEPLGNLVGRALHGVFSLLPGPFAAKAQDATWRKLASGSLLPFEESSPRLAEARRLADGLAAAGPRPALLCLFTHPPVTGDWLNLNIELTRHALWALRRLRRPAASRPRLVAAVDPFALDGFGLFVEGAYAGFMGGLHLGFDRLSSHRGRLSRAVVGGAAWSRVAHRFSSCLSDGGEVGIALGGGVPTTSRALYTAKEYVGLLRRSRRPGLAPRRAYEALAGADRDFAAFADSAMTGPALRKSAWRMLEAWLIAHVTGAWGHDAAQGGEPSVDRAALTPAARRAAEACAAALGLERAAAASALALLEEELARETPFRLRLFRFLSRRVGRERPVVLVPLAHHGAPPSVRVAWGEPVAILGCEGERLTAAWADGRRETMPSDEFARAFVRKNLP